MYFYVCLCGVLMITSAHSGNLPSSKLNHSEEVSTNVAMMDKHNKTNLTLVSEGGTLLLNTPDLTLSKQRPISLITLDEELTKTKEKAVVPRKGVDMQADENNSIQAESKTTNNIITTIKDTTKAKTPTPYEYPDIHVSPGIKKITTIQANNTGMPKKPMILSYEALANMEKQLQSDQSKNAVLPSPKTMASSQMPSPNQDSIKKVYPSKANNSHPGLIMPIVITILVVPMFAIVGYFAVKRGQEAWRNRHYKRMDFLLDGMYND